MYQRILVPVDGSATSTSGLLEAVALAKICPGSTLRLLHIVNEYIFENTFSPGIYTTELIESLRAGGSQILDEAENTAKSHGIVPERVMLETIGGAAADSIVMQAKQWPADLIVMGTHGRRGLARVAMGSDAEDVVRVAGIPVLLVRGAPKQDAGAANASRRKTA